MQNIDTLIHARWIIPVVPENEILDHFALAIHNGKIIELLPQTVAQGKYSAHTELHLNDHALIPGLINAHTHAAMSLMRGLADDLPLMTWLNEHIWPAESRWISEEFIHDGSQHAIAEMLRGGTTCFNDMYFFPEVTAKAALQAGIRACVGMILIDFPSAWAGNADEYLEKGLKLHDELHSSDLITTAFAPHAPYTVSDGPLERIRVLSDQMDIPIHMHIHETAFEVSQGIEQSGKRPIQRLDELGLITDNLMAVHMTQLSDEEIEQFGRIGASVIHCPESNLKLASGFCPVARLAQTQVNLALGTDGAASNNDLDMFGEMHTAALLGKAIANDASALPAHRVLSMATINGAKALSIEETTGSLEVGKAADVVAVDLNTIETQPLFNPISQLVYATGRQQVSDVWVAGNHLLKERRLTRMDESDIIQRSRVWAERIAQSDAEQRQDAESSL